MGKSPGDLLEKIDFSKVLGEGTKRKRVSTKILLLSVGMSKDEFQLKDVKGEIIPNHENKELRNNWNVFSTRTIEDIWVDFRNKGLIEKIDDNSREHRITELGEMLWSFYVEFLGCMHGQTRINFLKSQNTFLSVNDLSDYSEFPKGLSDREKDDVIEEVRDEIKSPTSQYVEKEHYDYVKRQEDISKLKIEVGMRVTDFQKIILDIQNEFGEYLSNFSEDEDYELSPEVLLWSVAENEFNEMLEIFDEDIELESIDTFQRYWKF